VEAHTLLDPWRRGHAFQMGKEEEERVLLRQRAGNHEDRQKQTQYNRFATLFMVSLSSFFRFVSCASVRNLPKWICSVRIR
jgi:hypothetical protein